MIWFALATLAIVFAVRAAGMHRTVKAIDLAGLSFLSPLVRLCYRDEPQKQLREICQFIGLPLLAIVGFLLAWSVVAQHVHTKSGKLPSPLETWRSATSVMTFHHRENDKQRAYQLSGAERTAELARIETELKALAPLEAAANQAVTVATKSADAELAKQTAPLQTKVDELAASIKTKQAGRQATVVALTSKAAAGGAAERDQLLELIRANLAIAAEEQESLRAARAELSGGFAKSPAVVAALAEQTALAEQKQYLQKMHDQLTTANQGEKIMAEEQRLEAARAALAAAPADKLLAAATNVVRMEDRAAKLATAEYAKPATLPYQVLRSVLCVFVGFLIGSVIAIPLGILCGLSPGFMAALTPFIAVFKPVSPIVWLPVALIVVGGFIPDPDKHWLTTWLWDLPLLGAFKINPAFIASAITVALCSLWATMVNTAFGVASVDKDHLNVARVLRLGFWDRLVKIVFPSALPLVFAGLRISLGVGWMVLIAAELLSSSEGIGKFVWDQFNNGANDSFAKMVVVVFVVGAVGLLLDRMMIVFQRLVSFDGAPTAL